VYKNTWSTEGRGAGISTDLTDEEEEDLDLDLDLERFDLDFLDLFDFPDLRLADLEDC
jgi:hypothetical protein